MMARTLALGAAALSLTLLAGLPSQAEPPGAAIAAAVSQTGSKANCAPTPPKPGQVVATVGGGSPPAPTGGYGAPLAKVGACAPAPGAIGAVVGKVGSGAAGANPGVCPPGSPKDCQAKHKVAGATGATSGDGK